MKNKLKSFFKENWLYLIGGILGAIGGFLYWKFVGCSSGTCRITSKPLNSTLYFAMMGVLTFSLFKKKSTEHVK